MLSNKSSKIITVSIISFAVVALIGLIYAAFTGQLNITGTSTARPSTWNIHFENISEITTTGSAKVMPGKQPKINSNNRTQIEDYDVTVTSLKDSISFTFKVVNDGNYDAEISSLSIGTPDCTGTDETSNNNVCGKLTYTLTDENGASINVGDKLLAKDSKVMKVTLLYQNFSDASLLPTADVSIGGLGITIDYEQSGSALVKDNGEVANYRVYHQGDKITLNNEDYWVIEDSGADKDYVVALKNEPLTVDEVNLYGGVGTENNHVNRYTNGHVGAAYSQYNIGTLAYYTSETCGYVNGSAIRTGCINDYDQSDIKYVVDVWALDKFQSNELKIVNNYSARLITREEYLSISNNFKWRYNSAYGYWTMSKQSQYNNTSVCHVNSGSAVNYYNVDTILGIGSAVRPVINVYKSALEE